MTETDTAKAETGPETHAEGADAAIARKIWLAGLGAYGRIAAETQGVVEKLSASAHETFEQLVSQGAEVEEKVKATIAKAPQTDTVTHAVETAASRAKTFTEESRLALETSFAKVREAVSESLAPWNLPALGQAVDTLTARVDALALEVAALKAGKADS
jgi:poly(hydroxyalkanoate) granule-associated protein